VHVLLVSYRIVVVETIAIEDSLFENRFLDSDFGFDPPGPSQRIKPLSRVILSLCVWTKCNQSVQVVKFIKFHSQLCETIQLSFPQSD